jgi:hypothetical protein
MNTQREVFNKLFKEKTELATQKVELSTFKDLFNTTGKLERQNDKIEKEKDILSEYRNLQKRVDKIKSISKENIALVSKLEKYYNAYVSKGKDVGLDLEKESVAKRSLIQINKAKENKNFAQGLNDVI